MHAKILPVLFGACLLAGCGVSASPSVSPLAMSALTAAASPGVTKTAEKQFVSAVDVANAALAHSMLAGDPALRQAMAGDVGTHVVKNLSSRVRMMDKAIADCLKYPEVSAQDLATDRKFEAGWKTILVELQSLNAPLTEDLKQFIARP